MIKHVKRLTNTEGVKNDQKIKTNQMEKAEKLDESQTGEIEISEDLREELWPKKKMDHLTQIRVNHFKPQKSGYDSSEQNTVTNRIYLDTLGFLGKQMFQYASFYGIARDAGKEPFLSERSVLRGVFGNLSAARGYDPQARIYIEDGAGIHTPTLVRPTWGDMAVCCYLQSWRYFRHHVEDVRRQFRFQPGIMDIAAHQVHARVEALVTAELAGRKHSTLRDAAKRELLDRTPSVVVDSVGYKFHYIGVHVRRAGLEAPRVSRQGYRAAPLQYLHNALNYFRNKYDNALFLVVSDDMAWCKENITSPSGDVVFMSGSSPAMVDLAVLSRCDDVVMTGGAFGWWGGWLAGGEVIYWEGFWLEASDVGKAYRTWDYYLPRWRAMGEG